MREWSNFLTGTIVIVAVTLMTIWGVNTLAKEDVLWFVRSFDARAESIAIYWDGEIYTLTPGAPGYEEVMDAFAEGIANWSGYEGSVVFSEPNIERFRNEWRLLEVRFAEPVMVHTRHPVSEARTYLVPLSKTHAHWRRVFAFPGLVPWCAGPLNMDEEHFNTLVAAITAAVNNSN